MGNRRKTTKPKADRWPALRHHKGSGQGAVVLDGKWIYLGKYGRPETQAEYERVVGEWLANDRRLPLQAGDVTVAEVLALYRRHCFEYYRDEEGNLSSDIPAIERALRAAARSYGHVPATEFGPRALRAVRERFVADGLSRSYCNRLTWRIKRAFQHAVEEEALPVDVYQRLATVRGLAKGRTKAPEGKPVQPALPGDVEAVREHVSRQIWGLVEFQRYTGARPGEAVQIRAGDLDRAGDVWIYTPRRHKTQSRGHERRIAVGPRAQRVLAPFLVGRAPDAFLFSPKDAEAERLAAVHARRSTPLSCGNKPGSNRRSSPKRSPGTCYSVASYRRAIARACKLAGVPRWSPHRLRHEAATRIRERYGSLDPVQAVLGHRHISMSEVYGKLNFERAARVAKEIG